MIFQLGYYKIDVDIERTRDFYQSLSEVSSGCYCGGCRNYEIAVDTLPEEVTCFFDSLGIDMKKIREVYVNCSHDDKTVYYGGFYHLCGTVLEGESAWKPVNSSLSHWDEELTYKISDNFNVSFSNACHLVEENHPLPIMQLEIAADLPWVLEEDNPYVG